MKRTLPVVLMLLLTGCVPSGSQESAPETTAPLQTTEAVESLPPLILPTETATAPKSDEAYYRDELERLLEEGTESRFAMCDVDEDGRDELVVISKTEDGETETVFDGSKEEYHGSPAVFYHNGAALTEGDAMPSWYLPVTSATGDTDTSEPPQTDGFTPYHLYQYDAEWDGYYEVVYVDRLDLATLEKGGHADEYPEDADTSGSGFVYLIGNGAPVDVTEYALWRSSWETEEIVISFTELTPETVGGVTGATQAESVSETHS